MTQIQNITSNANEGIQSKNDSTQNISYDEIVENLVTQGLPHAFNPNNYLAKIADTYSISVQDARTCLKQAINVLEEKQAACAKAEPKQTKNEDVPFQQSGYYYANEGLTLKGAKNDGMDNLNSYGSYNRLMFGIA